MFPGCKLQTLPESPRASHLNFPTNTFDPDGENVATRFQFGGG